MRGPIRGEAGLTSDQRRVQRPYMRLCLLAREGAAPNIVDS